MTRTGQPRLENEVDPTSLVVASGIRKARYGEDSLTYAGGHDDRQAGAGPAPSLIFYGI